MLTVEEYIAKRKKEDQLNEFSLANRMENMKTCVNYVFEYFNQYLDISKLDEQTVLNNERLEKYKNSISEFEEEIQEWLVHIYDEYNKKLDRTIVNFLKKDELFYLYSSDSEFRSLSYECYAQLVKKNPFLKDQTEMLFLFIKDYKRIQSQPNDVKILISDEVDQWVEKTWQKYKVDILAFCSDWVHRFFDNTDTWPVSHRKKSDSPYWKYDYDYKQKSNLFNLNSLYRRISDKPFIKGKKQYLEIIMMYFWLHQIEGDEENYWQEYMSKFSDRSFQLID
ncbi:MULTISPECIES: hypothetical protein [Brevibacillus]|uniref:hypothetical protein n=1 Tax=Brevibacillus TaxID=55080 RepID=UPI001EE5F665|nr:MULTISPECIES: hypothetical protein [Brevibacillus]MCG5254785.1 hypothetical protein [Brevibacillus agri]WNF08563.1 hypothetical protein RFB14_24685 [Brevibacillus borstelensis]